MGTNRRFQLWSESNTPNSGHIADSFDTLEDAKECLVDLKLEYGLQGIVMIWEYDNWQISHFDPETEYGFRYFIMDAQSSSDLHRRIAQEEAQSAVNLDQVPYDAQERQEYWAKQSTGIKLQLTPAQEILLGEQLEYWRERFWWADMRADYDACEFCACYIVALESIFGTV